MYKKSVLLTSSYPATVNTGEAEDRLVLAYLTLAWLGLAWLPPFLALPHPRLAPVPHSLPHPSAGVSRKTTISPLYLK